jgi:hypothetical protein
MNHNPKTEAAFEDHLLTHGGWERGAAKDPSPSSGPSFKGLSTSASRRRSSTGTLPTDATRSSPTRSHSSQTG